jgi:hypothetical protein
MYGVKQLYLVLVLAYQFDFSICKGNHLSSVKHAFSVAKIWDALIKELFNMKHTPLYGRKELKENDTVAHVIKALIMWKEEGMVATTFKKTYAKGKSTHVTVYDHRALP